MIKEENKRIMVTLRKVNIDKLKIIMYDLRTRQPSKALNYLIENYEKLLTKK